MQILSGLLEWLKDPENRGAAQALAALLAVALAWAGGLFRWLAGLVRPRAAAPTSSPPAMTAQSGGVNVAGNARDIPTGARSGGADDPS